MTNESTLSLDLGARRRSAPVVVTVILLSVLGSWALWTEFRIDIPITGVVWALAAAAACLGFGLILVGIIVVLQRLGHRPLWAVSLGLAWGLAAVAIAGRANTAIITIVTNTTNSDPDWTAWITTPMVEETVKALGVALLVVVPVLARFGPLDGLFFGVVVGAGFQVVEDFAFSIAAMSNAPGQQGQALAVILFTRILGVASHIVYTGLLGASIGWVVAGGHTGRARRVLTTVVVWAIVATLHGAMNWASTHDLVLLYFLLSFAGLAALVVAMIVLRRREIRRLVDETTTAEGWGVLSSEELTVLHSHPRDRAERRERQRILAAVATAERTPDRPASGQSMTR